METTRTAPPDAISALISDWKVSLRARGRSRQTIGSYLIKWLVDEGEVTHSPMERMSPPTVPEQPVPVLDDGALASLLASCKGNTFENRRDSAIIRLLVDTGMRAGEICGLSVEDLDFEHQVAHVLGKGGRNRACPFGAK